MGVEAGRIPKRPAEIEALLQWAYREELPKQQSDLSWAALFSSHSWRYGCRIDRFSAGDHFPAVMGAPHDDALQLAHMVEGLPSRVDIEWEESRDKLIPDLIDWAPPDDFLCRGMATSPAALVIHHARMKTRPPWGEGPFRVVRVNGKNGKPLIRYVDDDGHLVEGLTAGRRYGPAAHCVLTLARFHESPPERHDLIHEIVSDRFEYAVWHAALVTLARESRILRSVAVQQPVAAARPWVTGQRVSPQPLLKIEPVHQRLTTPSSLPLRDLAS